MSHEEVQETAVYLVDDDEGSNRVEASVILKEAAAATPLDLGNYLKQKLPWYSVPEKIVLADSFPRTSTDKIDRGELREQARQSNDLRLAG